MIKKLLLALTALVLTTAVKPAPSAKFDPARTPSPAKMISKDGKPLEFHVRRSKIDAALANLPFELMNARAEPLTNKDGTVRGYQILEITEGSTYEQLGLTSGDSILAVDDQPLKGPTDALRLFTQLKGSSRVKVLIERNGVKQQVTYLIR